MPGLIYASMAANYCLKRLVSKLIETTMILSFQHPQNSLLRASLYNDKLGDVLNV